MSAVTSFNPKGHPSLAPTYSHISFVRIGPSTKLIQISGQVGLDSTNASSNPDFQSQVRHAFANLDKCLAAVGAGKSNIMHTRQYIVKMGGLSSEDFHARSEIYIEWLKTKTGGVEGIGERPPPAETLVGSDSQTEGCLFEVEALVVLSQAGDQ